MFKKILVPVDLAHIEKSKSMISQAKVLGNVNDAQITLLNVVMEVPPYVAVELPADIREKSAIHAKEALGKLRKDYGLPASTEIEIRYGNPANEILNLAKDNESDLIMIASHQPGLADYLLGSVAGKVVRHAKCTVMVLR